MIGLFKKKDIATPAIWDETELHPIMQQHKNNQKMMKGARKAEYTKLFKENLKLLSQYYASPEWQQIQLQEQRRLASVAKWAAEHKFLSPTTKIIEQPKKKRGSTK